MSGKTDETLPWYANMQIANKSLGHGDLYFSDEEFPAEKGRNLEMWIHHQGYHNVWATPDSREIQKAGEVFQTWLRKNDLTEF